MSNPHTNLPACRADLYGSVDTLQPQISSCPRPCKKQSDLQAALTNVTDPLQGRNDPAQMSSTDEAEICTDFQGLDLVDFSLQTEGHDVPSTNQQTPGRDEGGTYYIELLPD